MYASSVLTSSAVPPGKGLILNQTSCFGMALSGCSIITINVLLGVISKISGVEIPEFHRTSDSLISGEITTVKHHEHGDTICEEIHSNLVCHTVYPMDVAQFCTPGVYDSWIHRIEECTQLKLKQSGCKIENLADVVHCEGLKGNITQCIKELGDTACRQMKIKVFNIGIPMVFTVPKSFPPLVKGNKEQIRKSVQECMNSLDEESVNECVPNLYDALASIAMENPAYRPHSLSDEKNTACLAPLFKDCDLLSRESLQQHLGKDFGVFVNLTFGEGNLKWFTEIPSDRGKVTIFGVLEPDGKDSHHVKNPCSVTVLLKWKDSVTKCVSGVVIDLGLHDPDALTLKRMIDETKKCIDAQGSLPCQLETRTDYDHFLAHLLDLIRHHTVVKKDDSSAQSFWKRALGRQNKADEQSYKKCHDSLKFESIKDCAHNIYMYLSLLKNSPSSVAALARENEKNQDCMLHSLKDCPKPVVAGIMSIFMEAVGHRPREARDVIGAEPYRHKRLVSIHPMYGGVVTVCEEGLQDVHPETTPMFAPDPEIKLMGHPPVYDKPTAVSKLHRRTKRRLTVPNDLHHIRTRDTILKPTRPLPNDLVPPETSEEEFTDIGTDLTLSPQCTEEEVENWIAQAKDCSQIRLFQLNEAYTTECLHLDSTDVFRNVSLCISEMEPLMAQCGHDRIYVFESIMEHLQKMIQQLQVEATQKCQSTKFCLPEKTKTVKCAGPFFDHMREMKDTGNYESSQSLRSMKDVDDCLAAEMPKCTERIRSTFKEIVFITYGLEIPVSSKEIKGTELTLSPQCTGKVVEAWTSKAKACSQIRLFQLYQVDTTRCLHLDSQSMLGNVSLCISEMEPLMTQCGHDRITVFEYIMEHLQRMIQQLQIEATQNCQSTVFCLPEKPKMVKCAGPFFDHMREMKNTGKNYESSQSLRSMKNVDDCLAEEMKKCPERVHRTFKEIVFITYGVEIPESSKEINGNIEHCFIYTPQDTSLSGDKLIDFGTKPECSPNDADMWLNRIRKCIDQRIEKLRHKSLKVKGISSKKVLRYVGMCIHVHKVLPCQPSSFKVFEPLFKGLLSNAKEDLTRLVKTLKSQNQNAQVEIECIQQLDGKNMRNCIPPLYKDMNYLFLTPSPEVGSMVSPQCVANALPSCNDESLTELDYIFKSAMGFLHPSEQHLGGKKEGTNICRPVKALDIGYRACQNKDLENEVQYLSQCLEKAVHDKPPNSVTLQSGIAEAEHCLKKYTVNTCYFADEKSLSLMLEYTFRSMADFLKIHLPADDAKCLTLITASAVSKCAPLCYKYIDSLRKGQVVLAMSVSREVLECVHQIVKGCKKPLGPEVTHMFGKLGRVNFVSVVPPISGNQIDKGEIKEIRINRDVNDESEEYDSGTDLSNGLLEETSETITTLDETELDEVMEETENPKVRRVREVADDHETTPETSSSDVIPAKEIIQGNDEDANVTKIDLLTLQQCNKSSFSIWVNTYHDCFVPLKYKDSGRDLDNIIGRILVHIQECMKFSVDKRCFPSGIQLEEFLNELVNQAKDYSEMYLSQIMQGREKITDLQCIEDLSVKDLKNCTSNIFKFLDNLRNHLARSDAFEDHVKRTALCMRYTYEECSKVASTTLIEAAEVLLDLSNGTLWSKTVIVSNENTPPQSKSIGTKIVDFFKSVGNAIAKPFVWLFNAIKSLFGW